MHIFVERSSARIPISPARPATCTPSCRTITAALPVQDSSKTDQGRPRATSNQVPRAFSRQPRDTHTCRAQTSRACHAKRTALAAAAARTIGSRSSCYLMMNSTRESILMSSAAAELLAGDGDLTCEGGIGFEDGFRAILVTASAILPTVGSFSAPPTTSGDGLTAVRRSSRLIAAKLDQCLADQASTHVSSQTQGDGRSPCVWPVSGRVAWLVVAPR